MPFSHLPPGHQAQILEALADGIYTVDRQLNITAFNSAIEKITGYRANDVVGKPCHDVMRSTICETDCPIRETLMTHKPVLNREMDILDRDGRKHHVAISASTVLDGRDKTVGAVAIIRDFSEFHPERIVARRKYNFHGMVSRNPAMRRLFEKLPDVASSEATVLIQGESGAGKELVAKALHELSARQKGPLVVVNCGALPEQLLEAEIFGAKRGAYTGAVENRPGRLEMAQGGTLFLDEIGDLPLPLQVKLLRVLENREFQPLGAKQPQTADVRFVTATHRNLEQMVQAGTFRQDLYFRVNVITLALPPLRERYDDLPLLIDMAVDRFNKQYGKHVRGFSPEALQKLIKYDFPGNIRELMNIVEQAVILCREGEVGLEHLSASILNPRQLPPAARLSHRRPDRDTLLELLKQFDGNRNLIAKELGIERTTLWRWMKKLDIQ